MKIVTTASLPESLCAELSASTPVTFAVATGEKELLREVVDADVLIGSFGGGDTDRFRRLMAAARRHRPPIRGMWGVDQMDELLTVSDVVVSTLPGTGETVGLFDERRFRLMKRSAIFINVGRGETAPATALLRALREGWIAGAGL